MNTNSTETADTTFKGYRFKSFLPLAQPKNRMQRRADRTGNRFGRLRVIECLGVAPRGHRWWGCECDCGEKISVRSRELSRGHTQSCGCLSREALKNSKARGRNRLPFGHASRNELLASYIKSAKDRGYAWELSLEQFIDLVTGPCVYCGTARDKVRKPNIGVNGGFEYTGIDRVNNGEGYTLSNTVSCCWICNRAKHVLSSSEFQAWIDRLVKFQSGAPA